jgi:hypothetical protein
MDDIDLEVLQDLPRFVQACPPEAPYLPHRGESNDAVTHLYLHAHERVQLQIESTSDLGYGLWRSEKLAEAGISCDDSDAEAFAAGLVATLADHLSIRNLRAIVDAFQAELDQMEARRQESLAKGFYDESRRRIVQKSSAGFKAGTAA